MLKRQFGYRKAGYRGIAKNGAQEFALLFEALVMTLVTAVRAVAQLSRYAAIAYPALLGRGRTDTG